MRPRLLRCWMPHWPTRRECWVAPFADLERVMHVHSGVGAGQASRSAMRPFPHPMSRTSIGCEPNKRGTSDRMNVSARAREGEAVPNIPFSKAASGMRQVSMVMPPKAPRVLRTMFVHRYRMRIVGERCRSPLISTSYLVIRIVLQVLASPP